MAISESFGAWFARRRIELGFTNLSELARRAVISKQYLSDLEKAARHSETGKRRTQPSLEYVDRLARAMGVPVDEARLAAGYAPKQRSIESEQAARLVGLFDELPAPIQGDAIAIVETLWKRHRTPKGIAKRLPAPVLEVRGRLMKSEHGQQPSPDDIAAAARQVEEEKKNKKK